MLGSWVLVVSDSDYPSLCFVSLSSPVLLVHVSDFVVPVCSSSSSNHLSQYLSSVYRHLLRIPTIISHFFPHVLYLLIEDTNPTET